MLQMYIIGFYKSHLLQLLLFIAVIDKNENYCLFIDNKRLEYSKNNKIILLYKDNILF